MKPLSRNRRIFSLVLLLVVFIVLIPVLLLYSSGYRFNFTEWRIVETGGIYVHSDLRDTRVFVDDEFFRNGGTILRNTLVQRLPSEQQYSIRVEKEDHFPYYKDLYVYPNRVTEVRIMMLPMAIPFTPIEQYITDNSTSTSVVSAEVVTIANPEYEQIEELFATTTTEEVVPIEIPTPFNERASSTTIILNEKAVLLPEYILELGVSDIQEKEQLRENNRMVTWLDEGNIHVMWAGDVEDTPFFFCDDRGCRDRIIVSTDTDIAYYEFFPGRNDVLIIATENDIFAIEIDDRSRNNLQPIYKGEGKPLFRTVGSTLYVKDNNAILEAQL